MKSITKILVVSLILSLSMLFTACSDVMSVTLSITYPNTSAETNLVKQEIEVPKGSTVLDVIEDYAGQNGIEIVLTGDPEYINAIGGAANTNTEGWIYKVNGKVLSTKSDQTEINDGDIIEWYMGDKSRLQH